MTITGERVSTPAAGFNPTWQRHVAAYALSAQFLGSGRVLDLGCGVGHSYDRLAPRETVGLDINAAALAGQRRQTVVGDMRALPFADGSFGSVVAVQSIEHVPDGDRVVREAARVLVAEGVAVFVTPNRLTFGRPDEIIDPYHEVEYDPGQLAALLAPAFGAVEVHGLFGSPRYMELYEEERRRLDRLLRADPLRLRRAVPRGARQRLYDLMLTRGRRRVDPRSAAISEDDFELRSEGLESCLDVVAVGRGPQRTA
ncbi:MAG: class I SAM-dependent methyltransferase [Solirubrobacteraceae bacterium]